MKGPPRGLLRSFAYGAALVACATAAFLLQVRRIPLKVAESHLVVAGLGGFRSLIAEVVWFKADRLQDEGRYAELAQIASTLTLLEPHTSDVWAFAAWNLAYNVSVMMPEDAARWRWVTAALRLLRDEGLAMNPRDPVLYRELAWMFLAKIGGDLDSAAPHYRAEWRKTVEDVRSREAWRELKMEPVAMAAAEADYGVLDWGDPLASALYWARQGLRHAPEVEARRELRQIVWQALMLLAREKVVFAPRALQEMCTAYDEHPAPMLRDLIVRFAGKYGLKPSHR